MVTVNITGCVDHGKAVGSLPRRSAAPKAGALSRARAVLPWRTAQNHVIIQRTKRK